MRKCRRIAHRCGVDRVGANLIGATGIMDAERAAIAARRMMAGRNMAAAVADQYGYGPGYSYARQAAQLEALAYLRS